MEAVKEAHAKGQPVLVGTITIEASEQLSGMLRREGIQHKVLNAKFHELEAEIVADAGIHGAVTIATNMAGRGTDIKLDEEASVPSVMNPAVSTISCAVVPVVRETPVNPDSIFPWKTI